MSMIRRSGAAALGLMLSLTTAMPLFAQNAAPIYLDTITLTATGLPTEILRNPASVTVVEGDDIAGNAPVSVATLLRDVPGVQVVEEGIERISIRGESSRRVAVLIDGQRLTDHTNYGQPILIDPSLIERIEVVRGSSSVISGSQAIGGVVNIITRQGAAQPLQFTLSGGVIGATNGWRGAATAAGTLDVGAGELEYRLSLGGMEQGNRRTPNGILEQSDTSDRTRSAMVAWRQGNHRTGLEYLAYDLSANVPTEISEFFIYLPRRDLEKVALFHEITNATPWLERLRFDVHRQTIDREFLNDLTTRDPDDWASYTTDPGVVSMRVASASTDAQLTYGASISAEMSFSDRSRTFAGLEYEDDRLVSDKDTDISTDPILYRTGASIPLIPSPIRRHDEASIRTVSLYGQHEIDLSDTLTLTFGGRWYDVSASHDVARRSMMNGPFTDQPRSANSDSRALFAAGLVWQPDEDTAIRANVSQGYVYPSLSQLFLSTTAGGTTINGNPDLRPERATTFELGARRDRDGWLLDATLYHSRAEDYIAAVPAGAASQYRNIDAARTWGLELAAEYDTGFHGLTPYVSAALMQREFAYANGYTTTDSGTAALAGRVGLRAAWDFGAVHGESDLFLRGESGVTMRDDSGVITDRAAGYATLNLHTSVSLGDNTTAVVEVNNITDRLYQPWEQATGAGRSVNLFVTRTF
ncbi:MAG: TonB-dependent receptor [Rubellimicrobium sp.]|nr:TonB-dependent receptor [Rubellimicrobium sp.]